MQQTQILLYYVWSFRYEANYSLVSNSFLLNSSSDIFSEINVHVWYAVYSNTVPVAGITIANEGLCL